MTKFTNLTVLDHPLIQHKLTILRDKSTTTIGFRTIVGEIAMLMAYEATKNLPLANVEVETPLEKTTGQALTGKKLVLLPILRAGLGMVDGVAGLIPNSRIGHIGLYHASLASPSNRPRSLDQLGAGQRWVLKRCATD